MDGVLGGGLPLGVTVLSGEPDSCKSLLGNSICAWNDGVSIFTTGNPDPYAQYENGVFVPSTGEACFELAFDAIKSGARLVLIDSLAGVASAADNAKFRFRSSAATQRLLFHGLKELDFAGQSRGAAILATNEVRVDISKYKLRPYMPHITEDRRIVRLNIWARKGPHSQRFGVLHDVGFVLHVPTPGGVIAELTYTAVYPTGISRATDALASAVDNGALTRAGAYWRDADGRTFGPGTDNAARQWEERNATN